MPPLSSRSIVTHVREVLGQYQYGSVPPEAVTGGMLPGTARVARTCGTGYAVIHGPRVSPARWTWARYRPDGRQIGEAVTVHGRRLDSEPGVELLDLAAWLTRRAVTLGRNATVHVGRDEPDGMVRTRCGQLRHACDVHDADGQVGCRQCRRWSGYHSVGATRWNGFATPS